MATRPKTTFTSNYLLTMNILSQLESLSSFFFSFFCTDSPCDPGYYYCGDKLLKGHCLKQSQLCDGKDDCISSHADESYCSGGCPENYCRNGGTCDTPRDSERAPLCM